jgi:NAD(P)-dependent dehydrogenase (short-subunit alcohol dehydrogenase family)
MTKTVFITGVSGGLGSALATAFLADLWTVYGCDHKPRRND